VLQFDQTKSFTTIRQRWKSAVRRSADDVLSGKIDEQVCFICEATLD
jgi:hypothetical protein